MPRSNKQLSGPKKSGSQLHESGADGASGPSEGPADGPENDNLESAKANNRCRTNKTSDAGSESGDK